MTKAEMAKVNDISKKDVFGISSASRVMAMLVFRNNMLAYIVL